MGRPLKRDPLGDTFGRLRIIEASIVDKKMQWLAFCDPLLGGCGKTRTIMAATKLFIGHIQSCGECLKRDICLERNKASYTPWEVLLNNMRRSAKGSRNYEFTLTPKTVENLMQKSCFYCGAPPSLDYCGTTYTGLDRIDNNRGYTENNVVPCCKFCNRAKFKFSPHEFVLWLEGVMFRGRNDFLTPGIREFGSGKLVRSNKSRKYAVKGEKNPSAKLSTEQVLKMRDLAKDRNYSVKDLAEKFGVTSSAASHILTRRSWKDI